jgi:hypothetical protein
MTLTRGAGAFAISPMIRVQAIVGRFSPAFGFLENAHHDLCCLRMHDSPMEFVATTLLQMFDDRRAAPTDRLEDGSTILHVSSLVDISWYSN